MSFLEVKDMRCALSQTFELNDVSFDISEKGVYLFFGKSGSGKTALCRVLAGACEIDGGTVSYKGALLYDKDKQTALIKRKIGYVPQKSFFDADMTAFEVLDLIGKVKLVDPDKRFRQIKEAFELTGLSSKYQVLVSDLTLSERKRLSIAASLLGNPDVIIMDEPLQYMDKKQAAQIKDMIRMLRSRKVILIFTSRCADFQDVSDDIAFLHNGSIILWKNTDELLSTLKQNDLGTVADAYDALTQDLGEEN